VLSMRINWLTTKTTMMDATTRIIYLPNPDSFWPVQPSLTVGQRHFRPLNRDAHPAHRAA
jgi:hypothetical protein